MSNDRRRQKKLERKTAKRKEKKHSVIRQESGGLPARLAAAAKHPVLHCRISKSLEGSGIAQVMLSRALGGQVAVGMFLVDSYCLGIKDAWATVLSQLDYESKFINDRQGPPMRDIAPADARKLLEEAAEYAHSIGFSPASEFQRTMVLFGDIEASQSTATFQFGFEGKPHFIGGPNDTPARCRQVIAILLSTCGEGNFHYTIPLGGDEFLEFEEDDEDPRDSWV